MGGAVWASPAAREALADSRMLCERSSTPSGNLSSLSLSRERKEEGVWRTEESVVGRRSSGEAVHVLKDQRQARGELNEYVRYGENETGTVIMSMIMIMSAPIFCCLWKLPTLVRRRVRTAADRSRRASILSKMCSIWSFVATNLPCARSRKGRR